MRSSTGGNSVVYTTDSIEEAKMHERALVKVSTEDRERHHRDV
jgi:hypothetical protein